MAPPMQISPASGIAMEWTLTILSAVFVGLRIYLRYFRQSLFSLPDLLTVLSCVFFASCVASDTVLFSAGFWDSKLSFTDLPMSEIVRLLKMIYASAFPYYLCLWCVKLALLLLYYTLVPKTMRILRTCLHAVSAIVGASFIVVLGLNIFYCFPVSSNWTGECITYSERAVYLTSGALHIFTEIIIFILPFPLLRTLQLTSSGRRCMYSMFSLGFITIAVGLGRLACILGMLAEEEEQVIGICQVWGCVEMCISITVVCLPALKGLVTSVKEKKRSIMVARSGGDSGAGNSVREMMSFRCQGGRTASTATHGAYGHDAAYDDSHHDPEVGSMGKSSDEVKIIVGFAVGSV